MPLPNRRTIRLPNFDYGSGGCYFLTGCVRDGQEIFGNIRNGCMCLTDLGALMWEQYLRTFEMRPHFTDEAFVVMPNHWHALVGITRAWPDDNGRNLSRVESFAKPSGDTINAMMRGMLSAITSVAKKLGYTDRVWQGRFYDHVVRDEKDYDRIRTYILNNIGTWSDDRFFTG